MRSKEALPGVLSARFSDEDPKFQVILVCPHPRKALGADLQP